MFHDRLAEIWMSSTRLLRCLKQWMLSEKMFSMMSNCCLPGTPFNIFFLPAFCEVSNYYVIYFAHVSTTGDIKCVTGTSYMRHLISGIFNDILNFKILYDCVESSVGLLHSNRTKTVSCFGTIC